MKNKISLLYQFEVNKLRRKLNELEDEVFDYDKKIGELEGERDCIQDEVTELKQELNKVMVDMRGIDINTPMEFNDFKKLFLIVQHKIWVKGIDYNYIIPRGLFNLTDMYKDQSRFADLISMIVEHEFI